MTGLPDKPEVPASLTIMQQGNSSLLIILGINDGVTHRPEGIWRSPDYIMYNGAGVFLGKWTYEYLYISDTISMDVDSTVRFHQYSATKKEVLHSFQSLTLVEYEKDSLRLLTGSRFGNIIYYPDAKGESAGRNVFVCDESGIVLRHKAVGPFPISYPNPKTKLFSDLIVGGECELVYYPFTGRFNKNGAPIYGAPGQILQQDASVYTGSLPVINTVDWDNDGHLDIVTGNSEGRVLLFINNGTNENPSFSEAQQIKAASRPIYLQPGYAGSIQGPAESRWGYTCPTVTDWNGDGLFDIMMHSALSRHEVYLNTGRPGKPEFGFPVPLYCKGLELHGTWRVQPGAKKLDGRMAYVILDDDDEFHLYWQIDAYNVEDGGKLRLDNGAFIQANFLSAGGTGRLKIVLEDWDLDNITDMLVGTPRHGSVPDPVSGLPQSQGLKGAAVLFLKNIGTNQNPVFAFPEMIRFKGDIIYLGQHACSPEVWDYGQPDGPDLLVGEQDGRIRYYGRKDLSWYLGKYGNSFSIDRAYAIK
ncbi:MAG: VCBS repeat-containing protein [Bacteroidales bacterium]|nr:VCBS repeat-containing protein [Bacteroidales bacterium]